MTRTDTSNLPPSATFSVSAELDTTGETHTAAELGALIDSHVDMGWDPAPKALRLLGDGRVVDADWDPNAGDPDVIAMLVEE